jgi:hypothetical protein
MDPTRYESDGLDRRAFLKAALAIGGAGALSACTDREEMPDVPRGPEDPSTLPDRQFAWNEYLARDVHGNTKAPEHQLLVFLDYTGDGEPTRSERREVERTFRDLERSYQRGTGPGSDAVRTEGLLFMVGYSRRYFDRFDRSFPDDIDLPDIDTMRSRIDDTESESDRYDAVIVLTSDHAQILIAAEETLLGSRDSLNGVEFDDDLSDVFDRRERRTGFKGRNVVSEELDEDRVPESSPSAMGFRSGFSGNQATESRVALQDGPFADGTTLHVSRLSIGLDDWYDHDQEDRVELMFSPHHDPEDVGTEGDSLASSSQITQEDAERTETDAESYHQVGHTQKIARARDDDFQPRLLRRSEGVATDSSGTALNFTSVQREMEAFVRVRKEMNGHEYDVDEDDNGIKSFLEAKRRGNYLVPPRRARSLPTPDGSVD